MSGFSISNIFFILALLLSCINSVVPFFIYSLPFVLPSPFLK